MSAPSPTLVRAQSWTEVTIPAPIPIWTSMSPYFVTENVGFIYDAAFLRQPPYRFGYRENGVSGLIFRTVDGGVHWDTCKYFDSIKAYVAQLIFTSTTHGYAATTEALNTGGVYETIDGGVHWRRILHVPYSLSSLYATDRLVLATGIALSYSQLHLNLYLAGPLFRTLNDGASWDTLPTPDKSWKSSNVFFCVTGNKDKFVIATACDTSLHLEWIYSEDEGRTWTSMDNSPPGLDSYIGAMFCFPYTETVLQTVLDRSDEAQDHYSIIRLSDDKRSWGMSLPHVEIGAVVDGSECSAYVMNAGTWTRPGTSSQTMYATTDRGNSWHAESGYSWSELDDSEHPVLSVVESGSILYEIDENGRMWRDTIVTIAPKEIGVWVPNMALHARAGDSISIPIAVTGFRDSLQTSSSNAFELMLSLSTDVLTPIRIVAAQGFAVDTMIVSQNRVEILLHRTAIGPVQDSSRMATIVCHAFLSDSLATDVTVQHVGFSSQAASSCQSVFRTSGVVSFTLDTACGDKTIQSALRKQAAFTLFSVYPNPTTGKIMLPATGPLAGELGYELTNVMGVSLRKGILGNGKLDFTGIPRGTYFLRVYTPFETHVETRRVVIY